MIKFLEGVDSPLVENTVKDVADALVAVQVYESHELFGLTVEYIKQELLDLETPVRLACGAYGLLMRVIAAYAAACSFNRCVSASADTDHW